MPLFKILIPRLLGPFYYLFMATVFLLCGSTGAGKTTYSQKLAAEKAAQVFSIDEWMQNLFWKDAPQDNVLPWALERTQRCERQIWSTALRLLASGFDVILDLGFSKKEHREKFYELVRSNGHQFQLHFLDVPVDVRKERVRLRNSQKTGSFQFHVSDETFDWMESYFEAPQGEELGQAVVIKS